MILFNSSWILVIFKNIRSQQIVPQNLLNNYILEIVVIIF